MLFAKFDKAWHAIGMAASFIAEAGLSPFSAVLCPHLQIVERPESTIDCSAGPSRSCSCGPTYSIGLRISRTA